MKNKKKIEERVLELEKTVSELMYFINDIVKTLAEFLTKKD